MAILDCHVELVGSENGALSGAGDLWLVRCEPVDVAMHEVVHRGDHTASATTCSGRIPNGGGWRTLERSAGRKNREKAPVGSAFVHSALDDHSRAVYSDRQIRTIAPHPRGYLPALNPQRQITCCTLFRRLISAVMHDSALQIA